MDLGVKVNNEVRFDGARTIFTVIPESKDEALCVIRDALEQYVELPSVIKQQNFEPNKNIAVTQLEFTVASLQSQLQLIQASTIAYQQTIKAQSYALDVQKAALEELSIQRKQLILLNSIEKESDDVEPVIGELLQVKKFEKLGVCVDLPQIVRSLKRRYK